MRHAAWRSLVALFLCAAPMLATAAVFRDVRYDRALPVEAARQSMDVFAPDRPGPHPVVVLFDGDGDKSHARAAPQTFLARGYLLVIAGFRAPAAGDDAEATRDATLALAWVARQIASYGGDRRRLYVWGNGAAARTIARIANEPERLAANGGLRDALRGVIVSGPAEGIALPLPTGSLALPPRLVLIDGARVTVDVVTASESLRALGADVQLIPVAQVGAIGASGDEMAPAAFAWMEAQGIERLQRAENLRFARFRAGVAGTPRAADVVVGHRGALYAATRAGAGVWRADAPQAAWQRERGLETVDQVLDLVVAELGDAATQGDAGRVLLLLGRREGRAVLALRGGRGWSFLALPDPAPAPAATRLHVARQAAGRGAQTWLAPDRSPGVLYRLEGRGGEPRLLAAPAPGTAITGLAVVNGALVAATAATAGNPGGLFRRRDDGTWERLGALASFGVRGALEDLAGVPDPYDASREVALGVDGDRIVRIDLARRGSGVIELDLTRTFSNLWGSLAPGRARVAAPGFVSVLQPESGDPLWLATAELPHPDRARGNAWYLVRRADGRYAYGRAEDVLAKTVATTPRIVPSPFAQHGGRAVLYFGHDGAAVAGWFDRALPRLGLWRDRADPEHALFLARAGDAAFAYVLAAGDDGPGWSLALGGFVDGAFVSDRHALATYRRDRGNAPPQRDDARRQAFSLRFGVAADDPACRAIDRRDATALAVLTLGSAPTRVQWCLEPAPGSNAPTLRNAAGLWFGGATDGGWTIAVDRAVGGADTHLLLFAYDADGAPRWLEGLARTDDGRAAAPLSPPLACRACAHAAAAGAGTLSLHVEGPCQDLTGYAQIDVRDAADRDVLVRRGVRLERAAGGACY